MDNVWLKWSTPVLAALTALLEASHEGNLFRSEVVVLIFAILTAVSAFTASITSSRASSPAPPPQQTPQPQKK